MYLYFVKNNNLEKICQGLLCLGFNRSKAYLNWVMATCSHSAHSVVELSHSRHFHYHYSNLSKVSHLFCENASGYEKNFQTLLGYFMETCVPAPVSHLSLSQDMCMVSKPCSPCLSDKVYGHEANSLGTGVVEGYKLAFTHLHLEKSWSPPIAIEVLLPEDNAVDLAVKQLTALWKDDSLPFGKSFCINSADSGYGNARYLCPLYAFDNLVNVVRLRSSMKVYPVFRGGQKAKCNPKVYGNTYYLNSQTAVKTVCYHDKKTKTKHTKDKLQTSIMDCACDDFREESIVLGNGKKAIRKVWVWKNMLIRSKKGNNMKDKPFDLLKIEIWKEDKSAKIFVRDMFLAVTGQRRVQVSTAQAVEEYRTRFQVEGCYRFSKQKLFLGKFQTPDKTHFLTHLLVILSAWWLLYAAKDEVQVKSPVWQQYLSKNKEAVEAQAKQETLNLSPSQVRKGMADLFDTFDKTPYLPTKYQKGKGRVAGTQMTKRERHKTVKKAKKQVKKE